VRCPPISSMSQSVCSLLSECLTAIRKRWPRGSSQLPIAEFKKCQQVGNGRRLCLKHWVAEDAQQTRSCAALGSPLRLWRPPCAGTRACGGWRNPLLPPPTAPPPSPQPTFRADCQHSFCRKVLVAGRGGTLGRGKQSRGSTRCPCNQSGPRSCGSAASRLLWKLVEVTAH
jgi:hypothetical protein